jgi:hypothetical protein
MRSNLSLLLLLSFVQPVYSWGIRAHHLQVRAAIKALPASMPAFFRSAAYDLSFLSTEPDRWRNAASPLASEATGPNHMFALEWFPPPWPRHRHAFILGLNERPDLLPEDRSLRRIGTAPYAIAESSEILTQMLRRWRALKPSQERRVLERAILVHAGILAHWITDLSMPLHCSAHVVNWHPAFPDPDNYRAIQDIHNRYENRYVESLVERKIILRLPAIGSQTTWLDWLTPLHAPVQACNAGAETIYRMDRAHAFDRGQADPAASEFTVRHLTAGATMLRDYLWMVWQRSAEQM